MASRSGRGNHDSKQQDAGVTRITVAGFKSIREEQSIDVAPLTILAGANSSGKSSMMQPLLLLKQTLEASYDPAPLLLDGPNVRFTKAGQFLSRSQKGEPGGEFRIAVQLGTNDRVEICLGKTPKAGFGVRRLTSTMFGNTYELTPEMDHDAVRGQLPLAAKLADGSFPEEVREQCVWRVRQDRCFLGVEATHGDGDHWATFSYLPAEALSHELRNLIHLPALRGNRGRDYPVTAVGESFLGGFDAYVASVIAQWQTEEAGGDLTCMNGDLELLGLTWKAVTRRVSDAHMEIQVARLPRSTVGGEDDLVNVADVGIGVSQVLPVLVALQVARPGQLVYIEQPEIHLHPRAQVALAKVFSRAAKRGVRVVVETHSSLLLLAVQALVAEGKLSPDLVKLHWFTRSETDGTTRIDTADLDEAGAFGEWPEDFGDVEWTAENAYLNAAEKALRRGMKDAK
ncbi:MAG: AAA family ATPase [Candidatus Nealsonbacteria bacterium]|nr:AAA family ATPase [Candidatus Nealsonbacteria bacterium]